MAVASRMVTCLGEAMAVLIPDGDESIPDSALGYTLAVGGAEANVACSLAALGVPVRWVSRLGDDRFGRVVSRTLAERGVDVSDVEIDVTRQTGLYVKEIVPSAQPVTRMRYYRAGSAACAMGPQLASSPAVRDTPLLHLSGITAALSESCAALIDAVLATPQPGRLVSFDVNLRPALWSGRDPAVLLELARRADVVFVGADEAAAICGVSDPDELRRLLPEPHTLIVKQGADGAVGFAGSARVRASALPVDVAEPTGAGDAFAAGFIYGTLLELPLSACLKLGTLTAASVLRVLGDFAAMPDPDEIARFLDVAEPGVEASLG
jgi:2-dehydro-3-deoxygluconokinase